MPRAPAFNSKSRDPISTSNTTSTDTACMRKGKDKPKGFLASSSPVASERSFEDEPLEDYKDIIAKANKLVKDNTTKRLDKIYADAKAAMKTLCDDHQHALEVEVKQQLNELLATYAEIGEQDALRLRCYDEIAETTSAIDREVDDLVTFILKDWETNQAAVRAAMEGMQRVREGEVRALRGEGEGEGGEGRGEKGEKEKGKKGKKERQSDVTLVESGSEQ